MKTRHIACIYLKLAIAFLLFHACSTDSTNENPVPSNEEKGEIVEEFRPYVDRFVTEMNQRGLSISSNELKVIFVDNITMPNSDRFCAYGYANFQNSGMPRVEIINNERCWGRRNKTEKENLMFHELGHALLQKGHINGTLPNGSQKSLMCASETCNNYRVYNIHQDEQRAYYLDQLANNETAIPAWAYEKMFSRTLFEDSFDNSIDGWDTEIGKDSNTEIPYDFYVDEEKLFSPPNALAIKSTSELSADTFGQWQRTYPISDFEYCSNILVSAAIVTEDFIKGSIGISIELLENNDENGLDFFARSTNAMEANGPGIVNIENFEVQVICLPEETAAIRVQLYMSAVSEGTTATFDNLEIALYE